MRIARSVNSLGGLLTFARRASNIAGAALSREMTERSRVAGGAKFRFISSSIDPAGPLT